MSPILLRKKLQKLAAENAGPVRDGNRLQQALSELEELKLQGLTRLATKCKHVICNREWVECLQLTNMVSVLEMVIRASLLRTESRGAMYRRDFPKTNNDEWLKNIIIRQDKGEMQLRTEPVVVTKLIPPKGIKKYPG